MSGYGFGKKPVKPDMLDLSGITRAPLPLDPVREEAAVARGTALGFVDRGEKAGGGNKAANGTGDAPVRRRRQAAPQSSLYIKGPKETLDWFVEFTNRRGHRSYWQTLAEFRELVEGREGE